MNALLDAAPHFLFFTGKGGVGKTSMACATAIALAAKGRRVLLVSTDPASNLDEVLATPLTNSPSPVGSLVDLHAMNIDPVAAAAAYRERIVGPYRGVLPESAVRSIEEQLSGACTVEIASFNEFTALLGKEESASEYRHIVLDTAPTGHTLRLLSLPAAWNDFVANNKTGSSCLGPLSGLHEQRLVYERAVKVLGDPAQTLLVLVSRADASALKEAAKASCELAELGLRNQRLILNGIFEARDREDALALAFERRGRAALAALPDKLRALPTSTVPYRPSGFVGIQSLSGVFDSERTGCEKITSTASIPLPEMADFERLVDRLAVNGSGVVMTMGKGGVGKTTLAAAIALELARRGFEVHLSTTDPAAHVSDAVGAPPPNLTVSRIDPAVETRAHVAHVLATTGANLDEQGRALLEEELRSPCTEEIAVFQAFARMVAYGTGKFVVLDTAPTGHTLLLLDATEAYHREVLRSSGGVPEAVRELLPRLRDPDFTKTVIVTLPEATPVHEAAQLQADLRRAGIEPNAWVINQSFAATVLTDPILKNRADHERRYIAEVAETHSVWTAIVPWKDHCDSGRLEFGGTPILGNQAR